ncbi:MAG TPA: ATP synthase F1 subunit gamma [Phycisphaerae bacterium]|nr:ATP synthase F1 subunit gamma [Phycisphaerae bacterium]
MAKARQIVKRRKAVTNIRKITKTMQLIATARFQQAFQRATATKPYTQKITQLVEELSAAAEGQIDHPLLKENPDAPTDLLLVLTSNRGLCGGYNAGVLRKAMAHMQAATRPLELHVVGKKGIAYFRFMRKEITQAITTIDDRPRFEQVEPLATTFMKRYEAGELGAVYVTFMRFISTGRQVPETVRLLPLSRAEVQTGETKPAPQAGVPKPTVQYDFSPEPGQLLKVLLPQTVKVRLYQCFTDAAVSEQTARMVAMKAATDAAGDMIKSLSRQFNRARQSQITMELLDIVGCAEALK